MEELILNASKLCKTFANGSKKYKILDNLDIEIKKGDFTVIMGASGSGKSTLLYALSGMDRPSSGSIVFLNKQIESLSNDKLAIFRRENCGFVFQQMFLLNNMSVLDNILACGLLISNDRTEIVLRAKSLLSLVGLTEKEWDKLPQQLSGGQVQRAAIVRALINNPQIVFADEPTGALNSVSGTDVLNVLTSFNEGGQSIIMVTHDLKSARRGNRILYIRDGVICGECMLGKYRTNDAKRKEALRTFLGEMGW